RACPSLSGSLLINTALQRGARRTRSTSSTASAVFISAHLPMSDKLPRGWGIMAIVRVIEDLQPGFASGEKNVQGGVPHLRMNNIGLDGNLVLDLIRTVPEK